MSDITQMGVWGNHSPTMYPDLFNAASATSGRSTSSTTWNGSSRSSCPTSANAAPRSSRRAAPPRAASAANAAIDHVNDWVDGSSDWVSMGIPSDGSYGIPEGLICGFPCMCTDGHWKIVEGLDIDEFSRAKIDASVAELTEERDTVKGQGLI